MCRVRPGSFMADDKWVEVSVVFSCLQKGEQELQARGELLITRTRSIPLPAAGGETLLDAGERWGGDMVGEKGRAAPPLPWVLGR